MRLRLVAQMAATLAREPWLWPTVWRQLGRFAPDGWWRRRPFLPLPDRQLLRFRATTQYGDPEHGPEPADVIAWLRWCRSEARRDRV